MTSTAVRHETVGWVDTRRRVFGSWMVRVGVVIVCLFGVLAVIHPLLRATVWSHRMTVYDPLIGHDPAILSPTGPSLAHPLGTDPLGRDVFSMLTYGLLPSFLVALSTALSAGLIGLGLGATSAFYRGRYDRVMTRVSDAFVVLPPALMFVIADRRGLFGPFELGLLYGVFFGFGTATIVVRSRALAVMNKPFIEAARSAGGSPRWIITRHLVPELIPHTAVIVLSGVVGALVTEGFLEYFAIGKYRLGLGNLFYTAKAYRDALGTGVPWSTMLTGSLAITLLASAFYMISSGLRDLTDPRQSGRRV